MSTPITKPRTLDLAPRDPGPRIHAHEGNPPATLAEPLGAMILMQEATAPLVAPPPYAAAWRGLHARSQPIHGETRVTTVGSDGGRFAVVGYCRADASAFEQLSVAGKAMKALAAANGTLPRRIGVFAGARSAARRPALLEAATAAACSHGFALPSLREPKPGLERVDVFGAGGFDARRAQATADAHNLARHLTALPPNVLDAAGYRRALAMLARRHGLGFRFIDEAALRRAGAGAFLAVSRGSATRDAGIAHLTWRPKGAARGPRSAPDVALVGKGIVFDTGGTNLKPHRGMLDMHTDMAGSAVAASVLIALAQLKYDRPVDAWLAITDNAIGPRAYRPQDVVRASNGVSVQVIHTDAEGRMVLADTLALAGASRPGMMIDFATLTGACVHALTERMSGVFATREPLLDALCAAGRASGERVWPFPLDDDYDTDIESTVADVAQCAVEGKGDHILATRFLKRFVPADLPWAHVDLSAASRKGGLAHVPTDDTGFGVRLTLSLLLDHPWTNR